MAGYVHGFHEGSRSEYLAAYVFSAFGTASAIPHQEDHGFDLYCTLAKRYGRVSWADKPFSVQVKSDYKPWKFKNSDSIDWFIKHPLPLLLCVVDKSQNHLSLYQTTPKFYYWTIAQDLPTKLKLIPQKDLVEGECKYWQDPGDADLSAPIAKFTVDQLTEGAFFQNVVEVLDSWLTLEYENLFHINAGVRQWTSPDCYRTNEPLSITSTGTVFQSGQLETAEELRVVTSRLRHSIAWIMKESDRLGDIKGALRAALFLRYFCRDEQALYIATFCSKLNQVLGNTNTSYVFKNLDKIAAIIDEKLNNSRSS